MLKLSLALISVLGVKRRSQWASSGQIHQNRWKWTTFRWQDATSTDKFINQTIKKKSKIWLPVPSWSKTEKPQSETEESRFGVTKYRHFKQNIIWCAFKERDKVKKQQQMQNRRAGNQRILWRIRLRCPGRKSQANKKTQNNISPAASVLTEGRGEVKQVVCFIEIKL